MRDSNFFKLYQVVICLHYYNLAKERRQCAFYFSDMTLTKWPVSLFLRCTQSNAGSLSGIISFLRNKKQSHKTFFVIVAIYRTVDACPFSLALSLFCGLIKKNENYNFPNFTIFFCFLLMLGFSTSHISKTKKLNNP